MAWRIVFLHGLESGPNGSKARYIAAHFPGIFSGTPDLQMSLFDVRKKNSMVRNFGNLRNSLDGCANDAMAFINNLIEAQQQGTKLKILLVASSWGGAVAIRCVQKGLQPDGMILLAPALDATVMFSSLIWPNLEVSDNLFDFYTSADVPAVTLVHGTEDDSVPVSVSRELKAQFPEVINYVEISGGDHRLNGALGISRTEANIDTKTQRHSTAADCTLAGLISRAIAT